MKALLIDPYERTIKEVKHAGDLKSLYELLDCSMVEAPIDYPNGDTLYCDEEGWVYPREFLAGFMFPDWDYPILGKALIVGSDEDGRDVGCLSDVDDFKNIIWKNHNEMMKHGERIGML